MHWTDLFNSVGSLFIVATASTKTMVPLRILAIVANCFLIAFYAVSHQWVPFVLQVDGLAQAVHERAAFPQRRYPLCQG